MKEECVGYFPKIVDGSEYHFKYIVALFIDKLST